MEIRTSRVRNAPQIQNQRYFRDRRTEPPARADRPDVGIAYRLSCTRFVLACTLKWIGHTLVSSFVDVRRKFIARANIKIVKLMYPAGSRVVEELRPQVATSVSKCDPRALSLTQSRCVFFGN